MAPPKKLVLEDEEEESMVNLGPKTKSKCTESIKRKNLLTSKRTAQFKKRSVTSQATTSENTPSTPRSKDEDHEENLPSLAKQRLSLNKRKKGGLAGVSNASRSSKVSPVSTPAIESTPPRTNEQAPENDKMEIEQDYISLDDVPQKSLNLNVEDETLPLSQEARQRMESDKRSKRQQLVDEFENNRNGDGEDDDEWERDLISKGASKHIADQVPKPSSYIPKASTLEPLPTLNEVLKKLRRRLEDVEIRKGQCKQDINRYKQEESIIESKQEALKESLQKASEEYSVAQQNMQNRRSGTAEP